jgi:DNA-binding MarR family transcriptional regulator
VIEEISREFMLMARYHVMRMTDREAPRLDRSAYLLLSRLDAEGPMSIGQLAEAFQLDTSTVNRQVAALVRNGDAERIPDPDGGMARKLRLTGEGVRRLVADRELYRQQLERVVEDWSEEDRGLLLELLLRFNRAVEERRGMHWPR